MQQQQHPLGGLDMSGLVLIGSPTCSPCGAAGRWLDQQGVPYRKMQIDGDVQLMQWLESVTGQRTIPQFFINGQWVPQGFPQIQQLVQQGQIPRGTVTQLPPEGAGAPPQATQPEGQSPPQPPQQGAPSQAAPQGSQPFQPRPQGY